MIDQTNENSRTFESESADDRDSGRILCLHGGGMSAHRGGFRRRRRRQCAPWSSPERPLRGPALLLSSVAVIPETEARRWGSRIQRRREGRATARARDL